MAAHIDRQSWSQHPSSWSQHPQAWSQHPQAVAQPPHVATRTGPGKVDRSADDQALLDGLIQGDEQAFSLLLHRYEKQMYRTAFCITRNQDDAQDALQEAFINVWKRVGAFRADSSIATWLTRIVINCSLMQLRKRRRFAALSLDDVQDDMPSLLECLPDLSADLEEEILRRDNLRWLNEAVRKLPHSFYEIVQEYRHNESAMADLARSFGLSIPAAKSRLVRARKALRDIHLRETTPRANRAPTGLVLRKGASA